MGLNQGDIVYQNGKPYIIDENGQLKPFTGKLPQKNLIYKDGKWYQADEKGNLIPVKEGLLTTDIQGRLYVIEQGSAIRQSEPCKILEHQGAHFFVGHDGKLYPLSEGAECFNQDNGVGFRIKDGNIMLLSSDGTAKDISNTPAPSGKHTPAKPNKETTKPSWQVKLDNTSTTLEAMKAPIQVISNKKTVAKTPKKEMDSFDEVFAKEQANIRALVAEQQQNNPYTSQNNQAGKVAFLKAAQQRSAGALDQGVQTHHYPYSLSVGSFIPANLISGINSDLPGAIIAQVSRNVYDTRTGNYLLIPQGTRLFGQ